MNLILSILDNVLKTHQSSLVLVVCQIEYGCQLWNPHCKKDIHLIENVQRFHKENKNVAHLDYRERLAALELFSL